MALKLDEILVSRSELADVLGLSGSRVGQLCTEKVFEAPEAHGKYKLAACVRAYVRHQREGGGEKSKAMSDFTAARTRWMESRARKAALEEQAIAEKYIPVDVMNETFEAISSNIRTAYLRVPSRFGALWPTIGSATEAATTLMRLINEVLSSLSDNPDRYDEKTGTIIDSGGDVHA
jgi:phage terminase Nu1 subunit (DNA packaging protein)